MLTILGIDPGLRITGYGIVQLADNALEPTLTEAGVIRLDAKRSLEQRLADLYRDLRDLIEDHHPHHLAVEKLYAHYKHPNTAILMGHARGVILLAGQRSGLEISHLPATEIKKAVTGYGHASKQQMQLAIQSQCNLPQPPSPPDVADAIAIALTCARRIATQRLT